jgi:hypothetical protein
MERRCSYTPGPRLSIETQTTVSDGSITQPNTPALYWEHLRHRPIDAGWTESMTASSGSVPPSYHTTCPSRLCAPEDEQLPNAQSTMERRLGRVRRRIERMWKAVRDTASIVARKGTTVLVSRYEHRSRGAQY